MKKYILTGLLALGACSPALAYDGEYSDLGWRQVFKHTEGKVVDFAIASSVEPVYYRDLINGRNAVGAQFPIVYVEDIVSCDFGYVASYDDNRRGTLAVGGSIRINKILEKFFPDKTASAKSFLPNPENIWDKLFFGPFISHQFVAGELSAGIKAGLKF